MKNMTIIPNIYDKSYLIEHSSRVFKARELIIEREIVGDQTMLRFKIGDGVKPYSALQYVSSLYALFPKIDLCDTEYKNCITISFKKDDL